MCLCVCVFVCMYERMCEDNYARVWCVFVWLASNFRFYRMCCPTLKWQRAVHNKAQQYTSVLNKILRDYTYNYN